MWTAQKLIEIAGCEYWTRYRSILPVCEWNWKAHGFAFTSSNRSISQGMIALSSDALFQGAIFIPIFNPTGGLRIEHTLCCKSRAFKDFGPPAYRSDHPGPTPFTTGARFRSSHPIVGHFFDCGSCISVSFTSALEFYQWNMHQ